MIIVVATDIEYKMACKMFKKEKIVKTGVGYGNVYRKLNKYKRTIEIINIGYAGGLNFNNGDLCFIKYSKAWHPNVKFKEKEYTLEQKGINTDITCYTSADFVTYESIPKEIRNQKLVFDMELYAILSMGFKRVQAIKKISDNLSIKEYEEIK